MPPQEKITVFRFGVGTSQDVWSHIWRMWIHGNDVYIGARESLRYVKVSLHESGIWRIARVAKLKNGDANSDRVIVRWHKPIEFAPGWTSSVAILVPSIQPKSPFSQESVGDKRATWFAPPQEGRKLLFKILFSKTGYSEIDLNVILWGEDRLATCMVKENGALVWLVVRSEDLRPTEEEMIRDAMAKTRIHLEPGSTGDSIKWSRMLLFTSVDLPGVSTQPTIMDMPLGKENLQFS